jgi:UDP-N-acetylmuramoyl-tripeptide--D-alanyl-D-alanine ligase
VIPLDTDLLAKLGRADVRAERFSGVQIDSRRIVPGDLFVALGRGVDFVEDAFANGAAATLVSDDPFVALAELGRAVRDRSSARIVGITGSMGKTSTKDILAALCAPSARTIAAEASYNNEIGVPLTLCRLEADTEICILELAMRGFGQIAELCEIARPQLGVITNIGPVHLEFVESLDGVARAKGELIDALPADGTAVVPADFEIGRDDIRVLRVAPPEVERSDGRTIVNGVSFNFTARHQVPNAATALAVLDALGLVPPAHVEVDFSRARGDETALPGDGLLINDAYNANPISMRAALAYLAERAQGRRLVAVLGDMRELGASGEAYHREIGEALVEYGVDEVLAVGELAQNYLSTGVRGRWTKNVEEALQELDDVVRPGDAVLVKGSLAVGLEAVAEALTKVPSR